MQSTKCVHEALWVLKVKTLSKITQIQYFKTSFLNNRSFQYIISTQLSDTDPVVLWFINPTGWIRVCKIIRIYNGCEMRTENSVTKVTVRHRETCRVMPNSYPEWRNFQFAPNSHYGFFFLHTLPSTIAVRLECVLFYLFYAEITTFFNQEMFGSFPI